MHFFELIAVNLCPDALISIQKAIIDNTNCTPPNSHHNLLAKLWFWKMFGWLIAIKPLTWLSPIFIKDPLFVTGDYSVKKWIINVSQKRASNTFQNVELVDFHWVHVELLHLANLLQMIRHSWNADTKFLRHFPATLPWVCSMTALKSSLSRMDGRPLPSSSWRLSLPLRNFWNHLFILFHHLWCLLPTPYWYLQLFEKHCYQAWTHARKVIAGLLLSYSKNYGLIHS